jgi:general secretion pathway protein G
VTGTLHLLAFADARRVGAFSGKVDFRFSAENATTQRNLERASAHFRVNVNGTRYSAAASAGFTLIEILVVVTIISLLLGLVGPRVLGYLGESRVKATRLQIESFSSALDLFRLDTGRYPTSSEGLDALTQRPPNVDIWNGSYLKGGRVPADPWGNLYQYRSSAERTPPYEILSLGSDGREGGAGAAADISNVEQ